MLTIYSNRLQNHNVFEANTSEIQKRKAGTGLSGNTAIKDLINEKEACSLNLLKEKVHADG